MRGILVYNGSFVNRQIEDMLDGFLRAFGNSGAELLTAVSGDFMCLYGAAAKLSHKGRAFTKEDADFILFWDKDVRLAAAFELSGIPVFNGARAVGICDDKLAVYEALDGLGIPVPLTVAAPFIYSNRAPCGSRAFLEEVAGSLGFPVVVKEACGSLGMQVYLASNIEELTEMYGRLKHRPHLYQKFIAESKGLDIRVYTIGGKAIGACERRNAKDFRSNAAYGGQMSLTELCAEYALPAEAAAKRIGLGYCAVDFLKGKDGPLLCEINSNAFFNTFVSLGGADIAALYADYIIKETRDNNRKRGVF